VIDQEFAIVGASGDVYELDAIDGFDDADETGVDVVARTKRYALYGPGGEAVLRRIFVSIEHVDGLRVTIAPIVDSRVRPELGRPFSRPPAGRVERVSLLLPVALRGTTFGAEFRAHSPSAPFHIETILFETIGLQSARSRAVNE